jgi:hypothetical protein
MLSSGSANVDLLFSCSRSHRAQHGHDASRQLVDERPPFEVEALGLERHHVLYAALSRR